ncbi:metalloproteinase inhibitor 1-like [Clavelina lepadiformis]|uniref:metalloproteinase inhibitor 1-like n=1 Tax=Clavelina lepadiformis TaxID=159417 RepID=UPI0040430D88
MNRKPATTAVVRNLILGLFVLATLLVVGESCSCLLSHAQGSICREDTFVALVKIKSRSYVRQRHNKKARAASLINVISRSGVDDNKVEEGATELVPTASSKDVIVHEVFDKNWNRVADNLRYRVKVYKAYKGFTTKGAKSKKFYIYTAPEESMCGTQFNLKGIYLVTGFIRDGRLEVGLCDHKVNWDSLAKSERRHERKKVKAMVSSCNAGCKVTSCIWSDCSATSLNECVWTSKMTKKYGMNFNDFVCFPDRRGMCEWKAISKSAKRKRRHNDRVRRTHQENRPTDVMP